MFVKEAFSLKFPFLSATEWGINRVNAKNNNDYVMSCSNEWSLCSLFISYSLQCIHVWGCTERREEKQQNGKNGIVSGHGWSSQCVFCLEPVGYYFSWQM